MTKRLWACIKAERPHFEHLFWMGKTRAID